MRFDPSEIYAQLTPDGSAQLIEGGKRFWSLPEHELDRVGQGWFITEFECSADWPNWEMHPEAEEFVYLSGALALGGYVGAFRVTVTATVAALLLFLWQQGARISGSSL